jgi:hypothetical protein
MDEIEKYGTKTSKYIYDSKKIKKVIRDSLIKLGIVRCHFRKLIYI